MRSISLASFLSVLLLLGTSGGAIARAAELDPVAPSGRDRVYVDSTEILLLESYPVQVQLIVRGSLPSPCHELMWQVDDRGTVLEVALWSSADPDEVCIAVLEPFEVSIGLGSFESADIPVLLDGQPVGRVVIGGPSTLEAPTLVGAGWSFGMCGGYCNADLTLVGAEAALIGSSHQGLQPLYRNLGTLTAQGLARLEQAAKRIEGVALEPVYGCPDCADGGASYLQLRRDGTSARHDMDFSPPPEELAELHGLAMSIISALETCASNELVSVAADCDPSFVR